MSTTLLVGLSWTDASRLIDSVLPSATVLVLDAVTRVFYILGDSLGLAVVDLDRDWELTRP